MQKVKDITLLLILLVCVFMAFNAGKVPEKKLKVEFENQVWDKVTFYLDTVSTVIAGSNIPTSTGLTAINRLQEIKNAINSQIEPQKKDSSNKK